MATREELREAREEIRRLQEQIKALQEESEQKISALQTERDNFEKSSQDANKQLHAATSALSAIRILTNDERGTEAINTLARDWKEFQQD